jgi:hypothetical protein
VPDGVHTIWAGHLAELSKVIGRLPRLELEVMLSGSDVFFIGVLSLLVVVALITAGGNGDPLGVPLWAPLIAFGASFYAFPGSIGQCPSGADKGHRPLALDKNGLDCLLTIGMSGGDVEKFLYDLWLITAEFVY